VSCEDKVRAKHCISSENFPIQRDTAFHDGDDEYVEWLDGKSDSRR
jgi:hypothetical protein